MTCRKISQQKTVPSPSNTCQYTFLPLLLEGPYPHGRIITGGREPPIVWTETQRSDGLAMTIPSCQVVHVGLEIFDYSALVRGG